MLLLSKLEDEIFQGLVFDTFTVAWFLHLLRRSLYRLCCACFASLCIQLHFIRQQCDRIRYNLHQAEQLPKANVYGSTNVPLVLFPELTLNSMSSFLYFSKYTEARQKSLLFKEALVYMASFLMLVSLLTPNTLKMLISKAVFPAIWGFIFPACLCGVKSIYKYHHCKHFKA